MRKRMFFLFPYISTKLNILIICAYGMDAFFRLFIFSAVLAQPSLSAVSCRALVSSMRLCSSLIVAGPVAIMIAAASRPMVSWSSLLHACLIIVALTKTIIIMIRMVLAVCMTFVK